MSKGVKATQGIKVKMIDKPHFDFMNETILSSQELATNEHITEVSEEGNILF